MGGKYHQEIHGRVLHDRPRDTWLATRQRDLISDAGENDRKYHHRVWTEHVRVERGVTENASDSLPKHIKRDIYASSTRGDLVNTYAQLVISLKRYGWQVVSAISTHVFPVAAMRYPNVRIENDFCGHMS
jgi:hypothetical protein